MKVEVIGTSCSWFVRNNTSFVIDDSMMFDISSGNLKPIMSRYNVFDLKTLFVTHFHTDHIGDFKILATMFIRNRKRLGIKKLKVYAPAGFDEYTIELNKLTFSREDETDINILRDAVEFVEIFDGMEFEEGGYKIKVYAVEHKMTCFGFTFTDKTGKTIAFSGDTRICDNLEKMLSVSDYAFVDMAATFEHFAHLDTNTFVMLQNKYPNCKMFPVHTSDPAQEFAINNGLNFINDGDILNF